MAQRLPLFAVLTALALSAPATAFAQTSGGAAAPDPAEVSTVGCGEAYACETGERMVVRGRGLDGVDAIEFLGARGQSDDRTARPLSATADKMTLTVPRDARSGPIRVIAYSTTVRVDRPVTITPGATRQTGQIADADGVFPIRGKHDMGQTATNDFGGARNHGGQDLFADCGTPLVAVRDTTVMFAGYQDRAGNYVVLQDSSGQSYAYMHMRDRPLVRKGDDLAAGEQVGFVGETGRATGCHVHFELWTAPGWYTGGKAVDPLPQLRIWEKQDHPHR